MKVTSGTVPATERSVLMDRVAAIATSSASCEKLEEIIADLERRQQLMRRAAAVMADSTLDGLLKDYLDVLEEEKNEDFLSSHFQQTADIFSIRATNGTQSFSENIGLVSLTDWFLETLYQDPDWADFFQYETESRPQTDICGFEFDGELTLHRAFLSDTDDIDHLFLTPNQVVVLLDKYSDTLKEKESFVLLVAMEDAASVRKTLIYCRFQNGKFRGSIVEFSSQSGIHQLGKGTLFLLPK